MSKKTSTPGEPDPEVTPRAQRRRFSAAYKLRIVQQADGCTKPGEIGALLRREGLYSSHFVEWRRARDQGLLDALAPKRFPPRARSCSTPRTARIPNASCAAHRRRRRCRPKPGSTRRRGKRPRHRWLLTNPTSAVQNYSG